MTWFENLTGVEEKSPDQVRESLTIHGDSLICPDGKRLSFGRLETPKLSEIRKAVESLDDQPRPSTIREVVGDVRQLHADPANTDAVFQVASQFNLLEMCSPHVSPERGVGIYENDHTQGPACAIACGAGTIFRNYFVELNGQIGQTSDRQIDCSLDIGRRLGNVNRRLWTMQNGYLFPTDKGLDEIATRLQMMSEAELNRLRGELRIGIQWHADVTLAAANHRVSQAYCSALPVAYGHQPEEKWTDFAKLVLEAAYEATIAAAVLNSNATGVKTIFLTLLGGGVFGNHDGWIMAAIERAFQIHADRGLQVQIVSYGKSKTSVAGLVDRIQARSC